MNKLIQTNDKTRVRRGTVADPVSLIIILYTYVKVLCCLDKGRTKVF